MKKLALIIVLVIAVFAAASGVIAYQLFNSPTPNATPTPTSMVTINPTPTPSADQNSPIPVTPTPETTGGGNDFLNPTPTPKPTITPGSTYNDYFITLTVTSAHGNPSPTQGQQYVPAGTKITAQVNSPVTENGVTYICTGWTGTGSVPIRGEGNSVTFTLQEYSSNITWLWTTA
jgi:hypothetical protein